ncbi:MAG: crossover junction endodeoxyribonuclease RuvC [Brevundimonas sp. 12-68-7]|uniref:Crossover junction endodeoxyribonuclease RuvC n=1 Tax=Brevundimonas subvibrioides TaxID=74313 RepID=A0A258FEI0_9CAUL|nr:MAG: crossover junction endodeoxyribonuclease RuvC [Brevundimonas sp. 12-68-7]OYX30213.1 MAG: crossover junction endodeoxyribonuclease RuvC [Brevundimonas subvibrioides]
MANTPIHSGATRILGLDPGLRRTGWGVVVSEGSRLSWVAHGVVSPPDTLPLSERLLWLLDEVGEVCAAHACDEAAIEEVFVNVNPASTLKLGHARAAVMLAPARAGLSVAEYSPNLIKKAVVGAGHADKTQITFMVKRLLPTCGEVKADAADALAVAITHAQLRRSSRRDGGGEVIAEFGAGNLDDNGRTRPLRHSASLRATSPFASRTGRRS